MSEDESFPPSVTEIAEYRYQSAQNAREGMRIDLVVLADKAIHELHKHESVSYSNVLAYDTQKAGFHVRATQQRTALTWNIPETQFFLPNWKGGSRRKDDFFGATYAFEHTLVKKTEEGFELITFEAFVKDCSRAEYITVCEGLDELINSSLKATSASGDINN